MKYLKYLLDTDAFSDIVRGNPHVEWQFSRIPLPMIGISSATVKEIEYGRSLRPERVPAKPGGGGGTL
jgi:predicted nucleic acid-binding protein